MCRNTYLSPSPSHFFCFGSVVELFLTLILSWREGRQLQEVGSLLALVGGGAASPRFGVALSDGTF